MTKRWWLVRLLMFVGLFVALVIGFGWALGAAAVAHSFYDAGCCDTTDCHPQQLGEFVKLTGTGWEVDVPTQGIHEIVAFDDRRLRDTPMDAATPFHICIWPKGTLRCFYRPGAAG